LATIGSADAAPAALLDGFSPSWHGMVFLVNKIIPFIIANNLLLLCPLKTGAGYKKPACNQAGRRKSPGHSPTVNGREALLENPRQSKLGIPYYKLPSKL
jgi:hypothetical protein